MDSAHRQELAEVDGVSRQQRARGDAHGYGILKKIGFGALALVVGLAASAATANTTTESTETGAAESSADATDGTESSEAPATAETSESDSTTPDATTPDTGTETTPEDTTPDSSTPTSEVTEDSTPDPSTPDSSVPPAPPVDEADRQRIEAAESAKAREVDAANARLAELTNALAVLQQDVESQSAEVEIATRRLETAEAQVAAAEEDVEELEETVAKLEVGLSEQAIRSFKGELLDVSVIEVGRNPNQTIRMQAMLAKATESDIDFVNALAGVREDLIGRRSDAERAAAMAEESRLNSEQQLVKLEADRLAQGELAGAAEARLDHLLSERAALAELGSDYTGSAEDEAALVRQLATAPAPKPSASASSASNSATISESDIRLAGKGIEVHVSIVDDIRQLLADAAAAGVDLAGGGYRDSAGQIRARRANCGTSNFAIYEMRSSQCRPPTARPGRSMHEQGKAIDFTYNGALIRSRSGKGWAWLKANAEKYGLFNLPSEPWHWSVNGR